MRRYTTNGSLIKRLRTDRDECSTQKELSHRVSISERLLRDIENKNAPITLDVVRRLAAALDERVARLIHSDDPVNDTPSVVNGTLFGPQDTTEERTPKVWPRWDDISVKATMDETSLFDDVLRSEEILTEVQIPLPGEVSTYVEELVALLQSVSRKNRDMFEEIDDLEQFKLRRRIRELLVLLKGNDVWVYESMEIKWVPESCEVQPMENRTMIFETVLVFAAPGEYGEDSFYVQYDAGQPRERID